MNNDAQRIAQLLEARDWSQEQIDATFGMLRNLPDHATTARLLALRPSLLVLEQLMYSELHRPDGAKYERIDDWLATMRLVLEHGVQAREATLGALLVESYELDRSEFAAWMLDRGMPLGHARLLAEQLAQNFAFEALEKIPVREIGEKQALLAVAVRNDDATRVTRALSLGADPNRAFPLAHAPDDLLPLALAGRYSSRNCVELLLRAGAEVNAAQGVALRMATTFGRHEAMQALIAAGAAVNLDNGAALFAAAGQGDVVALKLLLAAGADVNIGGGRALAEAISARQGEAAALLKGAPYLR